MSARGGGDDGSDAGLFVGLAILAAIWIVFTQKFEWIAPIWRVIRIGELWAFSFIPNDFPVLGQAAFQDGYNWLLSIQGENITREAATKFDQHYGNLFRWFNAGVLLMLAFGLFRSSDRVSRQHNMNALIKLMTPRFPFYADLVDKNPAKISNDYYEDAKNRTKNKDAISLTPMEFATMSPPPGVNLNIKPRIVKEKYMGDDGEHKERERKVWPAIFDRETDDYDHDLARRVFDAQIGSPYNGIDELTPVQKRIYDYMVPKLPQGEAQANKVMSSHAFTITGLMTLLQEARGGGVVAPLEFRWLKYEDRTLWYALSSVGRRVSFSEAGGPFAHWLLEIHLERPVPHKETTEAIEALYGAVMPREE